MRQNYRGIPGGACRSCFSLVEILMVLVIMAMLMVIAMPAFTEMMKGQGVEASARNLTQVLKLARSYAINNRQYVAVIIPNDNVPDSYRYRSYRACEVVRDGANYNFKRWVPNESWTTMSTGVSIVDINYPDFEAGNLFPVVDAINNVNVSDIGGSASVQLTGIIFKPTGQSVKTTKVYVGEGTFAGSLIANQNVAGNVFVSVNQFTGRVNYGE